jgi:hypothetical protein
MPSRASVNTLTIRGTDYVLAWVGGSATHLVSRAAPDQAHRPILDHEGAVPNPAYDREQVTAPEWSVATLCGRHGWFMAATEAGRAFQSPYNGMEEPAAAPTCKRCLRILDNRFDQPAPDERLGWNVARAVEEIEQWGCVHILDVPADQAELLRKAIRAEARKRGWAFQSVLSGGQLIAASEDALSAERRDLVMEHAMDRMRTIAAGDEPLRPTWRFAWS